MKSKQFWSDYQPGFRFARSPVGTKDFFEEVTAHRYDLEPHIPEIVGFGRWGGRRILEAGCGIGTDGARFAAAGALYTGLDFSLTATTLTRRRFELDALQGAVGVGSATALPFPDATFDLVFSHGVIHHVQDTEASVREFHRVLKPGGVVLAMVYHRRSFNYYVSIMFLRRILVAMLLVPGATALVSKLTGEPEVVLTGHKSLLSANGIRYILDGQKFLSHNTDGPENPLSKVYSRAEARALFSPKFDQITTKVRYLNLRLYPGGSWLVKTKLGRWLERKIGWHLYVTGVKSR